MVILVPASVLVLCLACFGYRFGGGDWLTTEHPYPIKTWVCVHGGVHWMLSSIALHTDRNTQKNSCRLTFTDAKSFRIGYLLELL